MSNIEFLLLLLRNKGKKMENFTNMSNCTKQFELLSDYKDINNSCSSINKKLYNIPSNKENTTINTSIENVCTRPKIKQTVRFNKNGSCKSIVSKYNPIKTERGFGDNNFGDNNFGNQKTPPIPTTTPKIIRTKNKTKNFSQNKNFNIFQTLMLTSLVFDAVKVQRTI